MPKNLLSVPLGREEHATGGPETQWSRWRQTTLRWSSKGLLAITDQGLISGSNYVMAILLARGLAPHQYGAYAIAFEIFLLMAVVYGAMVLEPFAVFGSSTYKDRLPSYFGTLLRIHVWMAAIVASILGIAAWIARSVDPRAGLAPALAGAALAIPIVLLFWLARRACYVKLSPYQAVKGAAVYALALLGGLLVLYRFGRLTSFSAFLLMAVGATAAAPTILARVRPSLKSRGLGPSVSEVLRKHWSFGGWELGGSLLIYASTAISYPILASSRGFADAGSLKALMNFQSPVGQVFAALSLLLLPYSARVHHLDGHGGTRRLVWKLTGLYTGGTALYWLVVVLLREPLIQHLYAGKYLEVAGLLPWVAIGSTLRISATSFAVTLRAMKLPSLVFVAYASAFATSILVGAPLTWKWGLGGAIVSFVLCDAVVCLVALYLIQRKYPLGGAVQEPGAVPSRFERREPS